MTFLTTRKMSPALAARIERSVGASRRVGGLLRLAGAALVVVLLAQLVATHYRARRELERARAELLDAVRAQSRALTPEEAGFMARVDPWLVQLSRAYEGDAVADDVRSPAAFQAALARPSVYVRGQLGAFASSFAIAEAAAASNKDALLLCLLDPPASRVEKAVVAKVRAGYSSTPVIVERSARVHRLHDAIFGVKELSLPWADRVLAAEDEHDLAKIKKDFARVPIEETKRATDSEILIVAMDEPDDTGPTELDGERAHSIRVGVVDLRAARVLVRVRKKVDPSWLSQGTRATYATGMDGCALAFDVHAALAH